MATQLLGVPLMTPLQLMNQNRTVSGVNIGHLWGQVTLLEHGKIKPRIDASYPFTEAAAAHQRILQRRNIGKILLTP